MIKYTLYFFIIRILSRGDRDAEVRSQRHCAVELLHNFLNFEICQIVESFLIGFPITVIIEVFLVLVPELEAVDWFAMHQNGSE